MAENQNPEALHDRVKDLGKKTGDGFVNPGTPESPLVSMDDRKTGEVAGSGTSKLRENLVPKG